MSTYFKLAIVGLATAALFAGAAFADDGGDSRSFTNRAGHYGIGSSSPSSSSPGSTSGSRNVGSSQRESTVQRNSGSSRSGSSFQRGGSSTHRGTQSPYFNTHHRDQILSRQTVTDIRLSPGPHQWHVTWPGGFIIGDTRSRRTPRFWYPGSSTVVIGGGTHYNRGFQQQQPQCRWVPGRYEVRQQQVYQPGYWSRQYVPPQYQTRRDNNNGEIRRVKVRDGYYHEVYVPGHYVTQPQQVWVPGYWDCSHSGHRH